MKPVSTYCPSRFGFNYDRTVAEASLLAGPLRNTLTNTLSEKTEIKLLPILFVGALLLFSSTIKSTRFTLAQATNLHLTALMS